jgi:hypothetical protein
LLFRPFASEVLGLGHGKSYNIFFDRCNCKECRDKEERRYIEADEIVQREAEENAKSEAKKKAKIGGGGGPVPWGRRDSGYGGSECGGYGGSDCRGYGSPNRGGYGGQDEVVEKVEEVAEKVEEVIGKVAELELEVIEKVERVVEEVVATPAEEILAKAAAPVKTITCSTCVAKDPLSFVAFASDETLERHQVKVHGAEPSEKLEKIMEEEKKAEEDELDVMDFGSDSEDEVVPLPVVNNPSIGAAKMVAIKSNMAAKTIEKPAAPAVFEEAKVEEVVEKIDELKVEEPIVDKVAEAIFNLVRIRLVRIGTDWRLEIGASEKTK